MHSSIVFSLRDHGLVTEARLRRKERWLLHGFDGLQGIAEGLEALDPLLGVAEAMGAIPMEFASTQASAWTFCTSTLVQLPAKKSDASEPEPRAWLSSAAARGSATPRRCCREDGGRCSMACCHEDGWEACCHEDALLACRGVILSGTAGGSTALEAGRTFLRSAVQPLADRWAVPGREVAVPMRDCAVPTREGDALAGRGPRASTLLTVSSVIEKHSTMPMALISVAPMRWATPSAGKAPKYSPSARTSFVTRWEPGGFWQTSTQPSLMIRTVLLAPST